MLFLPLRLGHTPRQALRLAAALCLLLLPAHELAQSGPSDVGQPVRAVSGKETLHYGVEWRLVKAGVVRLDWKPQGNTQGPWQADVRLQSTGFVSKLYQVDNQYTARLEEPLCATSLGLQTHEGSRHRDTRVTIDRNAGKANYFEQDLARNRVVLNRQIDVPRCVPDVIGALYQLRTLRLEPGQSTGVPMTDGKRAVSAKVEAQERERITTPAGSYNTVRYEVHMMNDVLFPRKGRVFVWLTDDARKLPVQMLIRMQFYIGSVTLQLEREEKA